MKENDDSESYKREKTYREQYEEYRMLNRQKGEIEERMDKVKAQIAGMLHEDQTNEKIVEISNGERWKAAYQTTSRSNTDLKLLMETVGPSKYGEIVTQKESTFLTIRKAGKEKKDSSVLNAKPVEDDSSKPFIPMGTVLS